MYVTNKKRSDGFGAQYQTIIFTILFAELLNLEFVYTPFTKMEHNYDNDPFFIEKKENLINIIDNFNRVDDIDQSKLINYDLSYIYSTVENKLDHCLSTDSFKKIKNLFFTKNKKNESVNIGKTVCIHIRRPNKYDIGDYGYSPDDHYLKIINKIKNEHKDIGKIKIYSQGTPQDFKKFENHGIEFNLNLPVEETFIDLVFSDILVQSKSSLSYCAGLLCDGIIYHTPFWHKPKNSWIKI